MNPLKFLLIQFSFLLILSGCMGEMPTNNRNLIKKETNSTLTDELNDQDQNNSNSLPASMPTLKTTANVMSWDLNSWGWNSRVLKETDSFKVNMLAGWSGFAMTNLDAQGNSISVSASEFSHIQFSLNPGPEVHVALRSLQLALNNDASRVAQEACDIASYLTNGELIENTWQTVTIPLSAINSKNLPYFQIAFFNNSTYANFSFEVKDIQLIKRSLLPTNPLPIVINPVTPTEEIVRSSGEFILAQIPTNGVAFNIDTKKPRKRVSPFIYGVNETVSFRLRGTEPYPHASFYRLGGNRTSTYNWENNASNAGLDWGPNISDSYFGQQNTPGLAVSNFITSAMRKNAASLVTVPMVPFVAANKNNYPLTKNASNDLENWKSNMAYNPRDPNGINTPITTDGEVYQQDFINFVEGRFNTQRSSQKALFYSLDNEPGLWAETHPLVMPRKVTYSDLLRRSVEFGSMIKNTAKSSNALVFGAVSYGYNEFVNLQDAPDSSLYGDWLEYFLKGMNDAEKKYGKRILDVLDIHFYSENRTSDNIQVTSDREKFNPRPELIEARVQAPRSLWDSSYIENSWISKDYLNGPVNLLPSIKSKISKFYPGTKLSISEYSYGGENHISGAIAQADALGIFARENVFAANYYELREGPFPYLAFDMFRNFDGNGAKVGNIMIESLNSDQSKSSVYTYMDENSEDTLYIIAINKSSQSLPVNLAINHAVLLNNLKIYQISGESTILGLADSKTIANNRLSLNLPAYSISTLVLKK